MYKSSAAPGLKELKWLSAHHKLLERHSGQWIAFVSEKGLLAFGSDLREVLKVARKKYKKRVPLVFKVPRKDEKTYLL